MNVSWERLFSNDIQAWLLESDPENPGVRYFTLRDILGAPADSAEMQAARGAVMSTGQVPIILAAQNPEGYWVQPGYYPKYTGTFWTLVYLSMLGADGSDPQIRKGCEHVLDAGRSSYGGFTAGGPAGMIHCLQGNLVSALILFGWLGDPRLDEAIDWMTRSVSGDGIAPAGDKHAPVRYYRSGNCGPGFECAANNFKPCAWGAVKVMLGLGRIPADKRTPAVQKAIDIGVDFLFSVDPAIANYPTAYDTKPNRSWFQFGMPVGYVTDMLQILEALAQLGMAQDPRLEAAYDLLLSKRDALGRWKMEYTYNGKTWADLEVKGQPSKWVTLRVLRVLKAALAHE